jgi:catechol 2,3-dioxygenase-like lactoylglutathione lyase family enzyme
MTAVAIRFKGPASYVADLARSRAFYEGLLGFTVARVMRRDGAEIAIAYTAGFAIWQAADAYWSLTGDAAAAPATLGQGNWENTFETGAAEAIHDRLVAAGATFVHPWRTLPWGQRGFRVRDPDGHTLDISESHGAAARRLVAEGEATDAIAARMSVTDSQIAEYLAGAD